MKRLDISDQTAVSMPMKNLIAIVVAVAVGVWAYFGIVERINKDKNFFRSFSSKNEQKCRFLKIKNFISMLNIFMTYDRNVPNDTAF